MPVTIKSTIPSRKDNVNLTTSELVTLLTNADPSGNLPVFFSYNGEEILLSLPVGFKDIYGTEHSSVKALDADTGQGNALYDGCPACVLISAYEEDEL